MAAASMAAQLVSTESRPPRSLISVLAALFCLLAVVGCRAEPPLPSFGSAPQFDLVDQQGNTFKSADLGQRVVLANFIYTSCTDVCPLLTVQMARVQDQLKSAGLLGSRVMLLSFSLDPERDTPRALRDYGEHFGVDVEGWRMLTGSAESLGQIAQDFKLGRPIPQPLDERNPVINLAHSNRFVLVDASGQLRATYSGDTFEVADVLRDIQRLAR
jgi:protein SCO1/2